MYYLEVTTHDKNSTMARIAYALTILLALPLNAMAARYDHPSGLGFDYPDGWQVLEDETFLVLVPPGSQASLQSEVVLLGAESLEGVDDLRDPAVVNWFDTQLSTMVGLAKRESAPEAVRDTVRLRYTTRDGRRHTVRYKKLAGLGAYGAHIGATDEHSASVERIFASYSGKLAVDTNLIGSWYRSEGAMSDVTYDASGASSYVSSNAQMQYTFRPDNKVVYESGASVYGQGGATSVSSAGDNPADIGTYSANGTRISIVWDDGSTSEYDYNIFEMSGGLRLKLVNPDTGRHKFWERN